MAGEVWIARIKGMVPHLRSILEVTLLQLLSRFGLPGWGFVGLHDDDGLGPHFPRRCKKKNTCVKGG